MGGATVGQKVMKLSVRDAATGPSRQPATGDHTLAVRRRAVRDHVHLRVGRHRPGRQPGRPRVRDLSARHDCPEPNTSGLPRHQRKDGRRQGLAFGRLRPAQQRTKRGAPSGQAGLLLLADARSRRGDFHRISTTAVDLWTADAVGPKIPWISALTLYPGVGNLRLARRGHSGLSTEITSKVQSPGELLRAFLCVRHHCVPAP